MYNLCNVKVLSAGYMVQLCCIQLERCVMIGRVIPSQHVCIQMFGVVCNSVLDRTCPFPYSLLDTTFPISQSLSNEIPGDRVMVQFFTYINNSFKEIILKNNYHRKIARQRRW